MNFKVSIGSAVSEVTFGEIIYKANNIQIESDFLQFSTYTNTAGILLCLGVVRSIDKKHLVDVYFDNVDGKSLSSVVSQLEGRFVLFFISNDRLYASSDQFGKFDIYYQQNQSNSTLASNLDLFPENPAQGGFDQIALMHTLTYYGYRPPKKLTLYNSVKRLGVDEYAYLHGKKITLIKHEFIAKNTEEYTSIEHDKYADIFLTHLKEVASKDGNLVYLSSGWDSTAILAGLVHLFGNEKVFGIIGRMKYSARSGCCNQIEIDKAKKFAKYYGIKLSVVDFDLTLSLIHISEPTRPY